MGKQQGYIKLWRIESDHWLASDHPARFVWWHLLSSANYKRTTVRVLEGVLDLEPGSIVTSLDKLVKQTGFSKNTLRRILTDLKTTQQITHNPTHLGTVITIRNWDKYQASENNADTPNHTPVDTINHTPVDTLAAPLQECKNIYNYLSPPIIPPATDTPKFCATDLMRIWNENCGSLPKCQKLTSQREAAARARIKEHPEPDLWVQLAKAIAGNNFCNGNNDRKWRADFDYFTRQKTIVRLIEGTMMDWSEKKKRETHIEKFDFNEVWAKYNYQRV